MKFRSKKLNNLVIKMAGEGDEYRDPYEKIKSKQNKKLTPLSRGGKLERSHTKRVGNIANKSVENRYDAADKALKRISNWRNK